MGNIDMLRKWLAKHPVATAAGLGLGSIAADAGADRLDEAMVGDRDKEMPTDAAAAVRTHGIDPDDLEYAGRSTLGGATRGAALGGAAHMLMPGSSLKKWLAGGALAGGLLGSQLETWHHKKKD